MHTYDPSFQRPRQAEHEFQVCLAYISTPCLKIKKKKKKENKNKTPKP
jgi:hypothetical protein